MTLADRTPLARRISRFITASANREETESFGTLALDIHEFQLRNDPIRAALTDGPVDHWQRIPALPVTLFKDLSIGTVSPDESGATFRTSGTTGSGRGAHHMHDTTLYDQGAQAWHRACVPDAPTDVVALLHDPAEVPDSSLSHMVAGFGSVTWLLGPTGVDHERTRRALDRSSPVYVAATAFALAELLDHVDRPLPAGSVVMVTGGFKGRNVEMSDDELYARTAATLRPARLITEYGMTELSSQLWGSPGQAYQPPPWLRAYAVDPATGLPRPAGTPGQLRFVDLCNLDASVAIETLDQGVVRADHSVMLAGRLEGSEARGCSLTVEELWERVHER